MVSFSDLLGRLPWWVAALLGALAVWLGLALIARPFDSLAVLVAIIAASFVITGISELAGAHGRRHPRLALLAGVIWIVAGLGIAAWPGLTIGGVAIFAGATMLVGGLVRLVTGLRGSRDERPISVLSGLASAIFGGLALGWPDVTVVVVALLVGPRMLLFGIGQIVAAFARRSGSAEAPSAGNPDGARPSRRWRLLRAGAAFSAALLLVALSTWLRAEAPEVDSFYDPPEMSASEPGTLLRAEPFTRALPPGARGWRILYSTLRDDDAPGVASAIIVAPNEPPDGPRPVIAWAHGTTGVERPCAPSLLNDPFMAGGLPGLEQVIASGWILVATDYIGLGTSGPHPYLIGEGQARSVLDSLRAARQLDGLDMAEEAVVWGHSQGGHAALWTGILAPEYAPELDIAGIAAVAPAADLPGLAEHFRESPVTRILMAYIARAYSRYYPEIRFDDYIRPTAREIVRGLAGRCLAEPAALLSIVVTLPLERPILSTSPLEGELGRRLAENVPTGPIVAPLLIAQGQDDTLVLADAQAGYVEARCAAGQRLEYRAYEGQDHISIVADDSPLIPGLLAWTEERFDGVEQLPGCRTVTIGGAG
ncbi:MAG TPA: lipase family protein [Thermomicrobiales bacterium]|nr:lipase family protein [Thermomicrobiales bacterium]